MEKLSAHQLFSMLHQLVVVGCGPTNDWLVLVVGHEQRLCQLGW
jgi:hypothetical protein